ncbi:hypothetical protein UFOVP1616_13 [uncultured Caudovirales phage]|uniref:Uncharacterized protein n=1 Tax=uncultured Caudovirales phage TaxID=2100421 RepID=A0A6J5SKM1_9CAUD|nr:hypothetical protein UFOVP1467_29 [uncultured Caudovirales phage]CAB4219632.1 hypothetical protein UFOVP1616_13 [uncultured Caudovirales phage]
MNTTQIAKRINSAIASGHTVKVNGKEVILAKVIPSNGTLDIVIGTFVSRLGTVGLESMFFLASAEAPVVEVISTHEAI